MSDAQRKEVPRWALALVLLAGVLAIYHEVGTFDFVNYDDDRYVTANEQVRAGPSAATVAWAFTTTAASNWHPLTWLSHLLDVGLFGLEPGGHHWTSVLLHAAGALLLFRFLARTTGSDLAAFLAAALFAWHPLRVESVAWVAERKDVLSGFFAFLTLNLYASWTDKGGAWRWVLTTVALALGLMAKPMLVTLPCVLLLVDLWPLRRERPLARLALEKLPWLALAAGSAWATMAAQQASGATRLLADLPLGLRLENALAAFGTYLRQTLWPSDLACLVPHPALWSADPAGELLRPAVAGGLALALGTGLGLARWKRSRAFLVGWLWTVGMLVPVIGLVQVGYQAHADRYTYLPFVGFAIALAHGAARLAGARERLVLGAACVVLPLLGVASFRQARTWRDPEALWGRCLEVTTGNFVAHNNLGRIRASAGDLKGALPHFEESVRLFPGAPPDPESALRFANLGTLYLMLGREAEAAPVLERAHELDREEIETRATLGLCLSRLGRDREAAEHLRATLEVRPDRLEVADALAWLLATSRDDALRDGQEATRLARLVTRASRAPSLLATLAAAQAETGNLARAVELQEEVVEACTPVERAEMRRRLEAYRAGQPWRKRP